MVVNPKNKRKDEGYEKTAASPSLQTEARTISSSIQEASEEKTLSAKNNTTHPENVNEDS